nr:katanin-interacting protein-like isoform X2 [Pocillopora verrucosa]
MHFKGRERTEGVEEYNRLINGTNVTMSDEHIWLIPFTDGQDRLLTVDVGHTTPLAKQVQVKLADKNISQPEGFLSRKECFLY